MYKAAIFLPLLLSVPFQGSAPARPEPMLIQGSITALRGQIADVKTPNIYPGTQGRHAMYVRAGRVFRVNLSGARVLLPDGQQPDLKPLAVGDRVVVLLSAARTVRPIAPNTPAETYSASVVERQTGAANR